MTGLILSEDLMFGSQVTGAVRDQVDWQVINLSQLPQHVQDESVRLLVLDLDRSPLPPDQLVAQLPDRVTVVAVGSHVRTARLAAARQAGCQVLTRGQLARDLPQLVRELAAT